MREIVATVVLIFLGTVVFSVVEGLGMIDSLYLTVMTLSSIGFGDIFPRTSVGQLFSVCLSLAGMGVFADFIAASGNKIRDGIFIDVSRSFIVSSVVCTVVLAHVEDWTWQNAAYFTITMATTVGYGDVVPVTSRGRLLCSFLCLWCLHSMAEVLALVKNSLYAGIDAGAGLFSFSSKDINIGIDAPSSDRIIKSKSARRGKRKHM